MQIFIVLLGGKTIVLEAEQCESVALLKQRVSEISKIPQENIAFYNAKNSAYFADEKTLEACGVSNGFSLYVKYVYKL
jgi:hypothetical protein